VLEAFSILPDPQTNGGLLIAVDPDSVGEVKEIFRQNGLEKFAEPIGRFIAKDEKVIHVME
jgi:selenide,water dikinase